MELTNVRSISMVINTILHLNYVNVNRNVNATSHLCPNRRQNVPIFFIHLLTV